MGLQSTGHDWAGISNFNSSQEFQILLGFQILKYNAFKYTSKTEKLSSGHRNGKGPFLFQSQRREMPKNFQITTQLDFTSHASYVILKILQARLQQYVNWEFPDLQAGFRKGRVTRDQIANIHWITEKAREFRGKKNLLLHYWLY